MDIQFTEDRRDLIARMASSPERYLNALEEVAVFFGRADGKLAAYIDFFRGMSAMGSMREHLARSHVPQGLSTGSKSSEPPIKRKYTKRPKNPGALGANPSG